MALSKVGGNQIDTVSGDLTVDTNTLVVDSANNRVGIGTASPSTPFETSGSGTIARLTGTGTNVYLGLGNTSDSGGYLAYDGTDVQFWSESTKRITVDSDGLKFGTDTAAANALDDYETGTFTPLMLGGTTNPSSTVAGSGEYVKIGNLVHIYIRFYNVNTTGASGYVRITGQPFTGNPTNQPVNMMSYDFDFGTRTSLTGEVNASEINGVISGDDAGWGLLNFGAGTARYLFVAGTYITS